MSVTGRTQPKGHITTTWLGVVLGVALLGFGSPAGAVEPDGEQLYNAYCAQCHDGQVQRAPIREVMSRLPANMVLHSLSVGKMRMQGWMRTIDERRALSEWITGKKIKDTDETAAGFCADAPGEFAIEDGAPQWNGWGVDSFNSRFQSAEAAGISAEQVPRPQGQMGVRAAYGFSGLPADRGRWPGVYRLAPGPDLFARRQDRLLVLVGQNRRRGALDHGGR